MASISAIGYLPQSLTLSASRASPAKWRRPVVAQSFQRYYGVFYSSSCGESNPIAYRHDFVRRKVLISTIGVLAGAMWNPSSDMEAVASEFADMPALRGKDYGKTKMRYPDYIETESGLQYKDLRVGTGPRPTMGETVVVDWDGYTIGYYGRIFEARNKTKGGSFEGDDKDFFKFRLGSQEVIPAFEEAVSGMALGGIRRWNSIMHSVYQTLLIN
ncbi:peptidyl-prolyl cis-trans isomerase FKBP19, chloroplastic isoform X2 [Carica papaya]|uniref:peptidyl-prolyl cis-trans isomerase FKBP19, chloroplastic isoform X2 n=1 Tax=Carica papaya TaxID=3649 RepID=UPI000B8CE470|nr:peptidyl-prolyl cis-trans isomerase FKBP19, chloroplastic isoform X2 [Carica papaya]